MMDEEIILDDLPGEDSPVKKFIKRAFIMFMAIVLILLFSTYLLGYYAFDYLGSRSESAAVDKTSLTFRDADKIIIFEEDVFTNLQSLYFSNLKHEFKVCLFGSVNGNTYTVTKLVEPVIFEQSSMHVVAEPCAPDAIIDLHSHPFQKCIASSTDISYLQRLKSVNPFALMAVMCTNERISFYT